MKANYYEKLVDNIEKVISKGKYKEALKIIKEELSMPYVPMAIEKKLNEYYFELKTKLSIELKEENLSNVFSILKSPKVNELEKYDLIRSLSKTNLSKEIKEILKLLLEPEKNFNFFAKLRLCEELKKQKLFDKVELLNRKNEKIIINSKDISFLGENKYFAKESLDIDELLFKHPIAQETAFIILENYFYSLFPTNNYKDLKGIGYISSLVAFKMLGQKEEFEELFKKSKISDGDIQALVSKLIKNIDLK